MVSTKLNAKTIAQKKIWVYVYLLILVAFSHAICMIVNTDILRNMISAVLDLRKSDLIKGVQYLFFFMIMNIIANYLVKFTIYYLRKEEVSELEMDILNRYSRFKCWNVDQEMREYQAIFINDIPTFVSTRINLFSDFSASVLLMVFGIMYAVSIDVVCTCISVGLAVVLYVILNDSLKNLSTYEKKLGEQHNNCYSYTWNLFQNLEVLPFLNINKVLKKFDKNAQETVEYAKKKSKVFANVALGKNIINSGVLVVVTLCIAIGSIYVRNYTFGIPDILALFIVIPQISDAIGKFLQLISDYKVYKGIEKRLEKIFEEPIYENKDQEIRHIESIVFKEVCFSYSLESTCIRNANFEVKSGENLLLFGPSGCGKSTLVKLMLGLIEGYTGNIYLSGIDIKDTDRQSIWRRCTYIAQDNMILSSSIKRNIIVNEKYDEVKFGNIVHKVGLSEVISSMPDKERTELADGNILSSGEKQKLCLARALYKENCDVLIMDEATSALDPSAEKEIVEEIIGYVRNSKKILIWISHNDKMLSIADKVYRINYEDLH